MNFSRLRKVSNYEVRDWIKKSLNLTQKQYKKLLEEEIVEHSQLIFYKKTKREDNILIRLSIILVPLVLVLIIFGLPINYIITGR